MAIKTKVNKKKKATYKKTALKRTKTTKKTVPRTASKIKKRSVSPSPLKKKNRKAQRKNILVASLIHIQKERVVTAEGWQRFLLQL